MKRLLVEDEAALRYVVVATVPTAQGARTVAQDPRTHYHCVLHRRPQPHAHRRHSRA